VPEELKVSEDRSTDRVKTKGCGRLPYVPYSDTGRPLTLSTAKGPGWCVNRRSVEIGSRGNGAKELGGVEENEELAMDADLWRR